jgi:hypothetical protein
VRREKHVRREKRDNPRKPSQYEKGRRCGSLKHLYQLAKGRRRAKLKRLYRYAKDRGRGNLKRLYQLVREEQANPRCALSIGLRCMPERVLLFCTASGTGLGHGRSDARHRPAHGGEKSGGAPMRRPGSSSPSKGMTSWAHCSVAGECGWWHSEPARK